jgi:hypothetical protein
MQTADENTDGFKSYALAIRALREKCIRSGQILPSIGDATEQKWAAEGPVANCELEAARNG